MQNPHGLLTVGEILEQRRLRRGIPKNVLAGMIGDDCTPTFLNRVADGRTIPREKDARLIATLLNMDPNAVWEAVKSKRRLDPISIPMDPPWEDITEAGKRLLLTNGRTP